MPLNKPSPRLAILRAQLAAKDADEAFARALYSYSAQNPRTLRALPPLADSLPLPPSYWDDLEHWIKTLAPAKPAAPQPFMKPFAARLASTSSAADGAALIGAKPSDTAQQPAQKAYTHSVCIRAYGPWKVGEVACWDGVPPAIPANWLPCDESGWVTHVPTADALCPVPDGVGYKTKRRCGDIVGSDGSTSLAWQLGHEEMRVPHEDDIIAWRPIAWRPIAQS